MPRAPSLAPEVAQEAPHRPSARSPPVTHVDIYAKGTAPHAARNASRMPMETPLILCFEPKLGPAAGKQGVAA